MVRSEIALSHASEFLRLRLERSRLVRWMGLDRLHGECQNISLMTSPVAPPPDQDFNAGWGGSRLAPDDWLTDYTVSYVNASTNVLVLFEDLVSTPSDPVLATSSHPNYWYFEETLFWPTIAAAADRETVTQMKSWAAAINEIVILAKLPASLNGVATTRELSKVEMSEIAASITHVVTDVYDGEGYMIWERKSAD